MKRPASRLPVAPSPGPRARPSRLRGIISLRRAVQLVVGVALLELVSRGVPLGWVFLAGSAAGIVLGKFFCRWMCPLGAMMELMLRAAGLDAQMGLAMYFKLGCPIAWAGGLLNRVSLLRVKLRPERCTGCGRCDRACHVASLSSGASLHVAGRANASTSYACSRCLACIASCPTGALTIGGVGRRTLPAREASARSG